MALTKAEYRRRLDAALALTGMKRTELPDLLERRGIKRHAASRAGHPSDDYVPNEALAFALGKILGVGQRWFEEPDLHQLIVDAAPVEAEPPTEDQDLARRAKEAAELARRPSPPKRRRQTGS